MVAALVKPPAAIVAEMNEFKAALLHAVLGIAGEVGELIDPVDDENFLEECGDALFYCQDLRSRIPELGHYNGIGVEVPAKGNLMLVSMAGEIVDVIKKITIYNQTPTETHIQRLHVNLALFEAVLEHELTCRGFTREQALERNIEKLLTGKSARFAEGTYTDAQAEARRDKVEDDDFNEPLPERTCNDGETCESCS